MTLMRYTPSNLPASAMRALARHWGALLGLALFLVAGLAVLDDYGAHWDEFAQRQNAEVNLRYIADGDIDAFTSGLYVDHDKFYGMAFEAPLLLIERSFGIDDNRRAVNLSRHLHSRLLFLAGGLFVYLLALRLFGSRLLALFAMGFFLLHPRLYGHSFFNAKDIPFFATFIVALYLTHRAFRRDSVAAFALLGVGVGVLMNLRIMGLILVAAVPTMRALDFALAPGWAERKRVLLTTGVFALAAALTVYALLPYLWPEPVGRAAEGWTTLSNHPAGLSEFFRGTLYRSTEFPLEYLPVWISITTPPFVLLLGCVGALAILAGCAGALRRALRSEELRFGLLLVGCFALPVLAVMLPGGNVYNGWRQMYFLWAPFALLAAFGLRGLAGALGRRRLRAAVYGAAGAGLAAAFVSMALIHPNEHVYFNVFVDRATPGHLRWQYAMDYWMHSFRQGLEWLVEHSAPYSEGDSAIRASDADWLLRENTLILPESARERLADAAPFGIVHGPFRSWSRSAREAHRVEVYGNTVGTIESQDDLREVYDAVHGREPLLDIGFKVHRIDGALALAMEPCAPAFVEMRRWLTVNAFPVDSADLPAWRRGAAFEPRTFRLPHYGVYFEGKCVMSVPLPAYPVADFELSWSPQLLADGEAREKARRAREDGRLLASAEYDIYLADGELAYVNDSCDPLETERPFELNAHPERADDLPEEHRERGFERRFFYFWRNGAFVDGGCAAFFPLPDYPVAAIRTGQSAEGGGELWRAGFTFNAEPYRAAYEAAVSGEPLARGVFDVHMAEDALVYVKEPCEQGDAHARFFLHVVPDRAEDLPDDRRGYGFDNLGFAFFPNGALFEGRCAARIPLPEYPVAGARTGQRDGEGGVLWSAEFWIDPGRRWADAAAGALGEPLARGAFDIHLADRALVYVKEACDSADADARFFLHVVPDRAEDLPDDRREHGFDNLDFAFFPNGALFEGRCAARAALPEYPVAGVRTGQYVSGEGGVLWSAEFLVDPGRRWADAMAGASGEPVARGAFDIHLADGALVYVKEPCAPADTDARFFLHVVPERAEDLPEERQEHGFDTRGFAFFSNGALFEGSCAARAALPDYPIASVRTGQYARGVGEIWSAEFAVGR